MRTRLLITLSFCVSLVRNYRLIRPPPKKYETVAHFYETVALFFGGCHGTRQFCTRDNVYAGVENACYV
jgi:hypothetical protein